MTAIAGRSALNTFVGCLVSWVILALTTSLLVRVDEGIGLLSGMVAVTVFVGFIFLPACIANGAVYSTTRSFARVAYRFAACAVVAATANALTLLLVVLFSGNYPESSAGWEILTVFGTHALLFGVFGALPLLSQQQHRL